MATPWNISSVHRNITIRFRRLMNPIRPTQNMIVMFLCTELMFQGVTINLIAFGHYHGNLAGQAFVIFVLVIAAAEASLALGLVVRLFRTRNTLDADAWSQSRG